MLRFHHLLITRGRILANNVICSSGGTCVENKNCDGSRQDTAENEDSEDSEGSRQQPAENWTTV